VHKQRRCPSSGFRFFFPPVDMDGQGAIFQKLCCLVHSEPCLNLSSTFFAPPILFFFFPTPFRRPVHVWPFGHFLVFFFSLPTVLLCLSSGPPPPWAWWRQGSRKGRMNLPASIGSLSGGPTNCFSPYFFLSILPSHVTAQGFGPLFSCSLNLPYM